MSSKTLSLGAMRHLIWPLGVLVALQTCGILRLGAPDLDQARAQTAGRIGTRIADALASSAGPSWASRYVMVARLSGDPGDHIRRQVESALPARTHCILVTDTVLEDLRDNLLAEGARWGFLRTPTADAWKGQPVCSAEAALERARDRGLDFVIYGDVEDFRAQDDVASVRISVGVVDATARASVFRQEFEDGGLPAFTSPNAATTGAPLRHVALRMASWLLFVLLLPVCSAEFWKGLLARESNAINVASVLTMTMLDALLACVLMRFALSTSWAILLLILAFMASGAFNFLALNLLERRREQALYVV